MTGLLRHPRRTMQALANNPAHRLASSHALVHYPSGAIASFIPKNGCSTLRLSLAIANNCITGPDEALWIHANNQTFCAELNELVRAPYSFVILRCPFARLASAYLDKIVSREPEFWQLRRQLGDEIAAGEMSFRDFVSVICKPAYLRSNIHWRPQIDFLVYESYSDYFRLDRLDQAAERIRQCCGLEIVDARPHIRHGVDGYGRVERSGLCDAPAHEIEEMKRSGRAPRHADLYAPDLVERVATVYAEDIALFTEHFGVEALSFGPGDL